MLLQQRPGQKEQGIEACLSRRQGDMSVQYSMVDCNRRCPLTYSVPTSSIDQHTILDSLLRSNARNTLADDNQYRVRVRMCACVTGVPVKFCRPPCFFYPQSHFDHSLSHSHKHPSSHVSLPWLVMPCSTRLSKGYTP